MKASQVCKLFLAIMLFLHHPVAALNWQGTGNLDNSNMTEIWSYVDQNLGRENYMGTLNYFATGLSNNLNTKWAPAWNVVVVKIANADSYNDVVLYGYAFKNHWMWHNGWTSSQISGQTFSFVIWKDYNCQAWQSVNDASALGGFSSTQKTQISGWISSLINSNNLQLDPWALAKLFVDTVQASSEFAVADNHAYSIVLSQPFVSTFVYGRVCVVGSNYYYSKKELGSSLTSTQSRAYGSFILFQTR